MKITQRKIVGLLLMAFLFSTISLDAGISTWWANRQAVQSFKNKNYDEALLVYNDLIDKDPYNPVYNYNIGDVLYKQERYEDAKQAFQRAAAHATKNLKVAEYAWYGAGNSCYQLKQWQQAVDMYQKSLQLNPNNEQTLHNLKLAQKKLAEEKLQEMQDKLDKNKDKKDKDKKDQDQQNGDDQKSPQDQQGQDGDDSQDSQGSSSDNQTPCDNDKDKKGMDKKAGKDKKSQDQKSSGTEKQNEQGKEKSDQKNLDKKDKESNDGNAGDEKDVGQSGNQDDEGQEQDGPSDQPGDKAGKDLDNQLKENQQNLDEAESQVAEQGQKSTEAGDKKGQDAKEIQAGDEQSDKQLQDEQGSVGAQADKKGSVPALKKSELKNDLQNLYEAKSSDDERLDSYYAEIMKALEGQEENLQRNVIKNRVAEKMVGQSGKNSW